MAGGSGEKGRGGKKESRCAVYAHKLLTTNVNIMYCRYRLIKKDELLALTGEEGEEERGGEKRRKKMKEGGKEEMRRGEERKEEGEEEEEEEEVEGRGRARGEEEGAHKPQNRELPGDPCLCPGSHRSCPGQPVGVEDTGWQWGKCSLLPRSRAGVTG